MLQPWSVLDVGDESVTMHAASLVKACMHQPHRLHAVLLSGALKGSWPAAAGHLV